MRLARAALITYVSHGRSVFSRTVTIMRHTVLSLMWRSGCADFEAVVVGDMSERLQALVSEHTKWLHTNCKRQAPLPIS